MLSCPCMQCVIFHWLLFRFALSHFQQCDVSGSLPLSFFSSLSILNLLYFLILFFQVWKISAIIITKILSASVSVLEFQRSLGLTFLDCFLRPRCSVHVFCLFVLLGFVFVNLLFHRLGNFYCLTSS